jgi:aminomethyltransferase
VGVVTSGTYSLMLSRPLGMGYVEPEWASVGKKLSLVVRNQKHEATVVKLPFWQPEGPSSASSRNGKALGAEKNR